MDKYFSATTNEEIAISKSDVIIICVGTQQSNGDVDLSYLQTLIKRINKSLAKYPKDYLIILGA